MSEYFIKQPETDHTRGPLSLEQLISLGETGNITEDTLLYDEIAETWKPLSAFQDLIPAIFPARKRLSLNREEPAPTADDVATEITEGRLKPKISTDTILAAASGDTKDTKHIGNVKKSREKAASLAVPGIGTLLTISAIGLIFPAKNLVLDAIQSEQALYGVLLNPIILLGFITAFFAVIVFLGVTSAFSYVRILGGVTMGLMGYLFWAWESPLLMLCALLMGFGQLGTTSCTRYFPMVINLGIGIIGALAIAYFAITGIIIYP